MGWGSDLKTFESNTDSAICHFMDLVNPKFCSFNFGLIVNCFKCSNYELLSVSFLVPSLQIVMLCC